MNIFLFKLAVAVTPLVILMGAPCICRCINRLSLCGRRRRREMLRALAHGTLLR